MKCIWCGFKELNYLWRDQTEYPDYKAKNKFLDYQLSVLGDPCYHTQVLGDRELGGVV